MYKQTVLFTIGLVGSVFCAQFPAYFDQYIQRLGGAVDELGKQVYEINAIAENSGKTTTEFIDDLLWQTGPNAAIGQQYAGTITRQNTLATSLRTLTEASTWQKGPFLFLYADPDILHRTWQMYRPSLPVTWAGFIYAILGFFVAGMIYETTVWIVSQLFRAHGRHTVK